MVMIGMASSFSNKILSDTGGQQTAGDQLHSCLARNIMKVTPARKPYSGASQQDGVIVLPKPWLTTPLTGGSWMKIKNEQ
jgi:hypothetical protein